MNISTACFLPFPLSSLMKPWNYQFTVFVSFQLVLWFFLVFYTFVSVHMSLMNLRTWILVFMDLAGTDSCLRKRAEEGNWKDPTALHFLRLSLSKPLPIWSASDNKGKIMQLWGVAEVCMRRWVPVCHQGQSERPLWASKSFAYYMKKYFFKKGHPCSAGRVFSYSGGVNRNRNSPKDGGRGNLHLLNLECAIMIPRVNST